MIISAEHHDLIEKFERANDEEGRATKALADYMEHFSSGLSDDTQKRLFEKFEAAHEKKMKLYEELKKLDLSRSSQ